VKNAIGSCFILILTVAAASAAGWEAREFVSPLGDRSTGIVVEAENEPDMLLGIGCDAETGVHWRGVAVLQAPKSKLKLSDDRRVRLRFGDATQSTTWLAKKTPAGKRAYWAPEATKFVERLLSEEKDSPQASLRFEVRDVRGKAVEFQFPLAGLGAEVKILKERCKGWELAVPAARHD
jgi:hypothetical protein